MNNIKEIKKYSRDDYESNPLIYGAAERFLHLTIECVMDIANHVISDLSYRKPENNRDIFEVLFENKVIGAQLKENLCNMASFRNILVHDYIRLNRLAVYDIINNNLKDIEKFISIIATYL